MQMEQMAMGIDIGGTNVKVGLVDKEGKLFLSSTIPTSELKLFWVDLVKFCEKILIKANISWKQVLGVGIGIPGLIDGQGHLHMAPNLHWHNINVIEAASQVFPVPVKTENDANLAALGEHWVGAGKNSSSFIMITVGTGIGSGFIINDELYKGTGFATELGHMVINTDGPSCNCGNRGCLETLAAAPALVNSTKKFMKIKGEQGNATHLTVKQIFNMAHKGNHAAIQGITETAMYLGIGLANIINILSPEVVAVGGGVSAGGKLFLEPMLREAEQRTLKPIYPKVKIVPAALGNKAGMIGGANLFFSSVL